MARNPTRIRYGIISAIIVTVLILFNSSRPPLETGVQAAFSEWYGSASDYLLHWSPSTTTPRAIAAKIKILTPTSGAQPTEWLLPDGPLEDDVQRDRLARVLSLIQESRVYGNSAYLMDTPPEYPHVSIEVRESNQAFTAFVPLAEIERNIQMKNMLKLLEVFRLTPSTTRAINPSQT
jgi:hypothetical protein